MSTKGSGKNWSGIGIGILGCLLCVTSGCMPIHGGLKSDHREALFRNRMGGVFLPEHPDVFIRLKDAAKRGISIHVPVDGDVPLADRKETDEPEHPSVTGVCVDRAGYYLAPLSEISALMNTNRGKSELIIMAPIIGTHVGRATSNISVDISFAPCRVVTSFESHGIVLLKASQTIAGQLPFRLKTQRTALKGDAGFSGNSSFGPIESCRVTRIDESRKVVRTNLKTGAGDGGRPLVDRSGGLIGIHLGPGSPRGEFSLINEEEIKAAIEKDKKGRR